ncbi:MAG: putative GDSL-like lipase/acylhydrolase family protein [Prokaryotic dsDNA virus sp.]|nr:MAG: putative GDSL-like lipase/acylhydrolase family protein [Prokaryotic dsDNA virus sp.]|tara:strand:+ start:30400 stop:30957 length:558 start_codon:yes stop_codon:yes gene_type:complete
MIWNEILCVGDSITYGARDEFGRSFPAELAQMLTNETGEVYFCHNHGVNGETSSDLLRRIWKACSSHKESKIMTILIGTNDTQKDIPTNIYEDNLRQIITTGKIFKKHIFLLTLPKLDFTPLYLTNSNNINEYNLIIKKLALEYNLNLINLNGVEKHYIDGVHFKNSGNIEIAKRIKTVILNSQT